MGELAPSFDSIAPTRVPGFYTEFSANLASVPGPKIRKILIIGARDATATNTDDVVRRMFDEEQGRRDFGRQSPIGRMVEACRRNSPSAQIYALPELEDAGLPAESDWTITGSATANGTREWYIGSQKYTVSIEDGDDPTAQAVKMVAETTAKSDGPVTATNLAGVVTFVAAWKGLSGNELRGTMHYEGGDPVPGTAVAVLAFTGGTDSDHDMANLVSLIDDTQYDTVITQYNLAADVLLLEDLLLTRWGGQVQLEGHLFSGVNGTVSAMVTLGDARNSKHHSLLGCGLSQSPTWEYAAAFGGLNDYQAGLDPARPQQRMRVLDLFPPKQADMYSSLSDRDALLADGVSAYSVEVGQLFVLRFITSEQVRNGAPSTVHLDVTTMRQLMHYRYDWNVWMAGRHPNSKYGNDDDVVSAGQAIITDNGIRAEAVQWFTDRIVFQGLGRDVAAFKEALQVGSDPSDPNRANLILTPKLMRQFRILATQIQFILN